MNDFQKLQTEFEDEIALWPPSEQKFEDSLAKAKMNSGVDRISPHQLERLREMYLEATTEEMKKNQPKE